ESNGVAYLLASYAVKTRRCSEFTLSGMPVEGKLLLLQDQLSLPIMRNKKAIIFRSFFS
ncbi:unnamed protein product, partial [Ilex paraguariensis]